MLQLEYSGLSHKGMVRSNNEDSYFFHEDFRFAALADGMGGAAAGELASGYFIEASIEVFSGQRHVTQNHEQLVRQSFELTRQKILDHIRSVPEHLGMGCTGELLAFSDDSRFYLGHVGDSRTYLLRDNNFALLTEDHSFVRALIKKGLLSEREATVHPMRHVILKAIGHEEALTTDIIQGIMKPGDLFLLCSDGLTDMIGPDRIRQILIAPMTADQMARELIDEANASGGADNITALICRVTGESRP